MATQSYELTIPDERKKPPHQRYFEDKFTEKPTITLYKPLYGSTVTVTAILR